MNLNPTCTYSITMYPSISEIMGQIIRFYSTQILPNMVPALIIILSFQMRNRERSQYCQSTLLTLTIAISPIHLVLPSRIISYLLELTPLVTLIPTNDVQILQSQHVDFGILPVLMFLAGIGIVFLLTCLTWLTMLLSGTMLHKTITGWPTSETPHKHLTEISSKLPPILASVSIALGFVTCGSLNLCVGFLC